MRFDIVKIAIGAVIKVDGKISTSIKEMEMDGITVDLIFSSADLIFLK